MERWEWIPVGVLCVIVLAVFIIVYDSFYHHWTEEHEQGVECNES